MLQLAPGISKRRPNEKNVLKYDTVSMLFRVNKEPFMHLRYDVTGHKLEQ